MKLNFINMAMIGFSWILFTAGLGMTGAKADDNKMLKIAAFGDSLIAGYGLDREEGFVPHLEKRLRSEGYQVEIVNLGVSGDTTKMGLKRLNWSIGDDIDAVLLELGANDGLRGLDPDLMRANLDAMLTQLKARKIPVLLIRMMAPRSFDDAYIKRFDGVFPEIAQKHGVILSPFFLEDVAGNPELNQSDGIHPNKKGVSIMVENMLPSVIKLISEELSN